MIMLGSPPLASYSAEDEDLYRDLAAQTNLLENPKNVQKGGRPQSTAKYRLLEKSSGSGVTVFLPGDIRGLETKLSLLLAEFHAGNTTATRNEIVPILDELLRRKEMSTEEYKTINNSLNNDCNSIKISST